MKKIKSSVFDFDSDLDILQENIDSLKGNNTAGTIETNAAYLLKESSSKFLGNITIDNTTIQSIEINYENFTELHYKLLGGRFLAVKPIDEGFQYITSDGLCFTCKDKRVIQIVKDCVKPDKVSYRYCDEVTTPLDLVVKIIFNEDTKDIIDIVKLFAKNDFEMTELNCYRAITKIYRKLYSLITSQNYSTYFNLEKEVYYAIYKANSIINPCNKESLIEVEYKILAEAKSKLNLPSNFVPNSTNLLNYITEHTDSVVSLVKDIGNDKFIELYSIYEGFVELKPSSSTNMRSYNSRALLDFTVPINYKLVDDCVTIKGTINGLYYNILLSVLRLKKYQVQGTSDIFLINYINKINPNIPLEVATSILLIIESYICNIRDGHEILNHLKSTKNTILAIDDINYFADFINSEMKDLVDAIDKYNLNKYKAKDFRLITHENLTNLNVKIFELHRKTIKNSISEVFKAIEDFNDKNKNKLYISDVTNDSIYLVAPREISHVAADILNRTLLSVYEKTVKLSEYITNTDYV